MAKLLKYDALGNPTGVSIDPSEDPTIYSDSVVGDSSVGKIKISRAEANRLLTRELVLLRELRRRQCTRSFYEFVLDAFRALYLEDVLVPNWHIRYLCDEVIQPAVMRVIAGKRKQKDIIINIPPRSLKSFICTVCLPAWAWIHKPSLKFIGTSYSGDLSLKHNIMTKEILTTPWYQNNWGKHVQLASTLNTKEYFETTMRGFRTCTSTGGAVTGTGGDIIIVDDPINPRRAESTVERESANRYFDTSLTTRLDKPGIGLVIVVMQRLHQYDLTGHLLKKASEKYQHVCIPAELTETLHPPELADFYSEDGLFFPARFSRAWLESMKVDMGSREYSGQMLQSPKIEGGGIVQASWFKRFRMAEINESTIRWNFVADTAYTEKKVNDPSAIMSYGSDANGNVYIRAFSRVYHELPKLVRHIKTFTGQNGYTNRSRIYIEPKASGLSAIQQLRYSTRLNIVIDDPPKDDKVSRISDVSAMIEAGRVYLLDDAHWVDDFLEEVEVFPNGKHDEAIDLLSMALKKVDRKTRQSRLKYTFYKKNE